MKNALILGSLCMVIAGCGGGNSTPSPPPASEKLGAYIGTWESDCSAGFRETLTNTRTQGSSDSITSSLKGQWFAEANCTGAVVATLTESSDITAKYVATVSAPVILTTGTAPVSADVDQVLGSQPAFSEALTGPAVVRSVTNGQAQWCFTVAGGDTHCHPDSGPQPAVSNESAALHLRGNDMYILFQNSGIYTVDAKYTKK